MKTKYIGLRDLAEKIVRLEGLIKRSKERCTARIVEEQEEQRIGDRVVKKTIKITEYFNL